LPPLHGEHEPSEQSSHGLHAPPLHFALDFDVSLAATLAFALVFAAVIFALTADLMMFLIFIVFLPFGWCPYWFLCQINSFCVYPSIFVTPRNW
jgi:hypothetical protein